MRFKRPSIATLMIGAGAIVFIAYLYFVDIIEVARVISAMDMRIAAIAIALDLLCILLFSLGWKVLISGWRLGIKDAFLFVLVSIFGDLMIPTGSVSGEVLRISLTSKKTGMGVSTVTASVILHRLIMGITFGIALAVGMAQLYAVVPEVTSQLFLAVILLEILLGAVGVFAVFNARKLQNFATRLLERGTGIIKFFRKGYDPEKGKSRLANGFCEFGNSVGAVGKPRLISSGLILTLRWFLIALIPYMIFDSLGHSVSYWIVLLVSVFASMVQMIPVGIPGMIGVMEVSMTSFFIGFGIPANVAASVTLLTRLIMFWFELLLSAAVTSFVGTRSFVFGRGVKSASELTARGASRGSLHHQRRPSLCRP
ncbi:MAG: flippase-like domain-containing protein [Candidatus Methanosuratus sp.]|nr:flippase-like domain-containing protein [Candidatus Methanosuratincola sp.]